MINSIEFCDFTVNILFTNRDVKSIFCAYYFIKFSPGEKHILHIILFYSFNETFCNDSFLATNLHEALILLEIASLSSRQDKLLISRD